MSSKPTKPQRAPTEQEMRLALSRLASVRQHLTLLRDDDDPVAVLEGVIAENLDLRQFKEDVRIFAQTLSTKLTRG